MKKTIAYIIVLALLGGGLYLIYSKNKENIFGNREANFTIKDTASIGKIFMVDKQGKSVTLERAAKGWLLNGKDKVLQAPLRVLLTTLYKQTADYPVPEAQHNLVIRSMSGHSTKVEIYDRDGDLMRVFYVGGESVAFSGTNMLMENAKHPYVVNIPGFGGVLDTRYSTNAMDWKDRIVFDIPASDIQSISVQYTDQPLNSFVMKQENGDVTVKLDSSLGSVGSFNKNRANTYLGFFEKVYCEGFTNGTDGMDSTLSAVPRRCIIDVVGKNGYTQHLTVYWRPLYRRSKNLATPMPGYPNQYDADRYFAVFNDNRDTAVIQRLTFEKIFRNGYEFYQQSQVPVNETRDTTEIMLIPNK